jgi:lipopolysaccharide/colanic/teichoic acid biosynthesis glycosyltransferase
MKAVFCGNAMYNKILKRMFDFIIALVGLIILWPLLLVLSLLVRNKMGHPAIFKQDRAGWKEKPFTIYKFRTMTNEKDSRGSLLPDDQRITSLGNFLRRTSLDELPQLVNILKGDISIIGPRPLLVSYIPLYSDEQRLRHQVRPGLFGLAALYGRNNQSWDSKFQHDNEYVDNVSFLLDCKIAFCCVKVVFSREGIDQGDDITPPFQIIAQEDSK